MMFDYRERLIEKVADILLEGSGLSAAVKSSWAAKRAIQMQATGAGHSAQALRSVAKSSAPNAIQTGVAKKPWSFGQKALVGTGVGVGVMGTAYGMGARSGAQQQ